MKQERGRSDGDGVKQRVSRCMTKLSDRDTEAMAASELDAIARGLTSDTLTPFLSAISDARPTDKTPLRRHSVRLLSLLTRSHPASSLVPHLPRMLMAVLRRLRDPDSSIRSACVDAVRSMAAAHPPSVPRLLLSPLLDALLHEQDQCAQAAAALCLAAAIDVAADDVVDDLHPHLQRLVPRLVKLVKSSAFKAKPALLSLLGSIAGAGGASTATVLGVLLPCLVEFLRSEDWAARKAAAEALSRLAISERDLLGVFKSSCLSSFESRKFDKVKIVRESMNQMLEIWKDIPEASEEGNNALPSPVSKSHSSHRESIGNGHFPAGSRSFLQSSSPVPGRKKKIPTSRSPPGCSPVGSMRKTNSALRNNKTSQHLPLSYKKASDWKIEISAPKAAPLVGSGEDMNDEEKDGNVPEQGGSMIDAKMIVVEKTVGLKSAAQVAPFQKSGALESASGAGFASDEHDSQKNGNLSLIRMQLAQIENQQSNLFDLLQRFIGNSQNGLQSLETRVHGLEMALDGISHDLAISTGRLSNNDPAANTCCRLPGTEFLCSKFWRWSDGRYSTRYPLASNANLAAVRNSAEKGSRGYRRWDKQRYGLQVTNPLAEVKSHSGMITEATSNKISKGTINEAAIRHA